MGGTGGASGEGAGGGTWPQLALEFHRSKTRADCIKCGSPGWGAGSMGSPAAHPSPCSPNAFLAAGGQRRDGRARGTAGCGPLCQFFLGFDSGG